MRLTLLFSFLKGVLMPKGKVKTDRQTPILMFTERHHTGDSWNCEGKLFCPDKKSMTC